MADQIKVISFTTPASTATTWDITDPGLTETVKAGVFLYTGVTTNNATLTHAVAGISFLANDGVRVDLQTTASAARSVDDLNGSLPAAPTCQTVKSDDAGTALPIVIMSPTRGTANTIACRHDFNSFITNGVRLDPITVTDRTEGVAMLFAGVARATCGVINATTTLTQESLATPDTYQPDLLILSGDGGAWTATPTFGNDARWSLGFVINDGSSSQVSMAADWDNGVEPSNCDGEANSTRGMISFNPTGRAIQRVQFVINSTGFTHQLVTGAADLDISFLAIKFTSAPPMAVGVAALPTGTGVTAFSCGSVTPQVVMTASMPLAAADTTTDGATAGAYSRSLFSSTVQRAYAVHEEEGINYPPGNTGTRQGSHALIGLAHTGGSPIQQADFSAFGAGTFSLDFSVAAAGRMAFLAIGAASATLVSNDTEEITDGAVLHGTQALVVDETVEITDGFVGFTNEIVFGADPQGTSFQAGSQRGTALQGGAVAGTTLE